MFLPEKKKKHFEACYRCFSLAAALFPETTNTSLFQTQGRKDTDFYDASSHRRLKTIPVSSFFFFPSWQIHHKGGGGGGGGVCVCVCKEMGTVFLQSADSEVGTTSTRRSPPPHKAFSLCLMSVSVSFCLSVFL